MHEILKRWRGGAATARTLKTFGSGTVMISAVVALVFATCATAANEITLQIKDAPLKEVCTLAHAAERDEYRDC